MFRLLDSSRDLNNIAVKHHIDGIKSLEIDGGSHDILLNGRIHLCRNAMYKILKLKKSVDNMGIFFD